MPKGRFSVAIVPYPISLENTCPSLRSALSQSMRINQLNIQSINNFIQDISMSEQQFHDAADKVKNLAKKPTDDELLVVYALYKQATEGDVTGDRPGFFSPKERAKFDARDKIKGKSKEQARAEYIEAANKLIATYGLK